MLGESHFGNPAENRIRSTAPAGALMSSLSVPPIQLPELRLSADFAREIHTPDNPLPGTNAMVQGQARAVKSEES